MIQGASLNPWLVAPSPPMHSPEDVAVAWYPGVVAEALHLLAGRKGRCPSGRQSSVVERLLWAECGTTAAPSLRAATPRGVGRAIALAAVVVP